jgi:hypothetical protein
MAEIVGLRDVHDILFSKRTRRAFVAFIQHGTSETGYSYDVICPWCGQDLGLIEEKVEADGPEEIDPPELARQMKELARAHTIACPSAGFRLAVKKATRPLGTETKRRIM